MGGRPQRCTLVCVAALGGMLASAALAQDAAPRLAVAPFLFESDPDYGVFLADRIAAEMMQHVYFPR